MSTAFERAPHTQPECEPDPVTEPAPAAACPAGLAVEEWDMLFLAVVARLRQVLRAPPAADSLQGSAEDALLALERLHVLLADERSRAARGSAGPPRRPG